MARSWSRMLEAFFCKSKQHAYTISTGRFEPGLTMTEYHLRDKLQAKTRGIPRPKLSTRMKPCPGYRPTSLRIMFCRLLPIGKIGIIYAVCTSIWWWSSVKQVDASLHRLPNGSIKSGDSVTCVVFSPCGSFLAFATNQIEVSRIRLVDPVIKLVDKHGKKRHAWRFVCPSSPVLIFRATADIWYQSMTHPLVRLWPMQAIQKERVQTLQALIVGTLSSM
jgi:hypothetical protein